MGKGLDLLVSPHRL